MDNSCGVSICIRLSPSPANAAVSRAPRRPACPEEATSEAHIPTERPQTGETTRFPPSHGHSRRPRRDPQPPPEGSGSALGVIWRIRDRASFLELRRKGTRARSGAISVVFAPLDHDEPARVAYAVGRDTGGAVVRNRVRRRLRSALFATSCNGPTTLSGGLYLVQAGRGAVSLGADQLRHQLSSAAQRAQEPSRLPRGPR